MKKIVGRRNLKWKKGGKVVVRVFFFSSLSYDETHFQPMGRERVQAGIHAYIHNGTQGERSNTLVDDGNEGISLWCIERRKKPYKNVS